MAAVTASMLRRTSMAHTDYMTVHLIGSAIDAVIAASYVALVVAAIARIHRALEAVRPPRLTTYLVVSLVLVFTAPLREGVRMILSAMWGRTMVAWVWYALGWGVSIAMARYWVRVLNRSADLVGAQVAPESHSPSS